MTLDFYLHVDSSTVPADDLKRYTDIMKSNAAEKSGKLMMPHLADLITAFPNS